MQTPVHYIGRFAPSPSGPLHLGSLCTALGSYVHAKRNQGKWLLRIEDIDQPRTVNGADEQIMATLERHGMAWDGDVWYQSQRLDVYAERLAQIKHKTYCCDCTRAQIRARSKAYDGHCRNRGAVGSPSAVRYKHNEHHLTFNDARLGQLTIDDLHSQEDFILKRRDGLFAYNFVVVVDDIEQQISHIVRGADLLETTPCHLALYATFREPAPQYLHLPLICFAPHQKLSKQNHAPAVNDNVAVENLHCAIQLLGSEVPPTQDLSSVSATLDWAIQHLNVSKHTKAREVIVERD